MGIISEEIDAFRRDVPMLYNTAMTLVFGILGDRIATRLRGSGITGVKVDCGGSGGYDLNVEVHPRRI